MTPPRRNDWSRRLQTGHAGDSAHRLRRESAGEWLWGWHAVLAALKNPERGARFRLLATPERARALSENLGGAVKPEVATASQIGALLPQGAVHQGIALDSEPIRARPLADLAQPALGVLLMLDQVTDPQNVGGIFRSAAAFGAKGVILQDRHAPRLGGALAKAAAGGVDKVPHAREVNLSRALDRLQDLGWRPIGLDSHAPNRLDEIFDGRATVLVLGSEGGGMRRLVREHCDAVARIQMAGDVESMNVAAAAAIALYEACRATAAE